MAEWTAEHDRRDLPPVATLIALEAELIDNATEPDDVWIERAAAVGTVRAAIAWSRSKEAKLN